MPVGRSQPRSILAPGLYQLWVKAGRYARFRACSRETFRTQLTRSPEESPPNLWVHLLPRNNEAIKLSGRTGEVGFKNDGDIARRIE
jgi:hypothetical protein